MAPSWRMCIAMPSLPTRSRWPAIGVGLAAAVILGGAAYALSPSDPGAAYQDQLAAQSKVLYGFGHPLDHELSTTSFDGPGDQAVELAAGLKATLVSDRVGEDADMIALWPNDAIRPTRSSATRSTGPALGRLRRSSASGSRTGRSRT
jgi:hypothetical protein